MDLRKLKAIIQEMENDFNYDESTIIHVKGNGYLRESNDVFVGENSKVFID